MHETNAPVILIIIHRRHLSSHFDTTSAIVSSWARHWSLMTPLHRHWPHWLECCKSRGEWRARSRREGGRRRSMKCNYFNYPRKPRRQLFPIWISLPRICDNLLLFCFPSKSSPYWSLSFFALNFDWRTFNKIDYFLWYNDIMAEFLLISFFANSPVSIW